MNESHLVRQGIAAGLARLQWLCQNPVRMSDEIAYAFNDLIGLTDHPALPSVEKAVLLQQLGNDLAASPVPPWWRPQLDLAIASRLINLGEPDESGRVQALIPRENLASAHKRYAALAARSGLEGPGGAKAHNTRAWQLLHPDLVEAAAKRQQQRPLWHVAGDVVLAYLMYRARRPRPIRR